MQFFFLLLVVLSLSCSHKFVAFAQEDGSAEEEGHSSILLESVINNDVDGIDRALEAQENIDTVNVNGWSAAHFAVNIGSFSMLEAVVNRGIDLNLADETGYTALMMAASQSDLEMVELMVGANANPLIAAKNGDTAFSLAHKRHRVGLVIAEACAVHAIESSDVPALLTSIENGAYVNIHNAAGWTPLIFATAMGHEEAVQFLLRHGAEVDRQENDGWTALHFAASTGNTRLITLLMQAGASAGIRAGVQGEGLTAKELAKQEGFLEAAELIPDVVEQEL
eukprot:gene10987-12816_t